MSNSEGFPNLFSYATSELSQDAFICWLLAWADPKFKEDLLHQVANRFLTELVTGDLPLIASLEVKKQHNNIDIVVVINGDYAILIEDKVHSGNHSDQLKRYANRLKEDFDENRISFVYIKTGDQGYYGGVIERGYKVYHRKEFLNLLEYGQSIGVTNNIFLDFLNHIGAIEKSVNSYRELPVKDWHWDSWKGFYIDLQSKIKTANWKYVPQKNGGFLGFWWYWKSTEYQGLDFDYYLQLEHAKFCFKIQSTHSEHRRAIRDYYRGLLYPVAAEHEVDIKQNGSLGKTMTVAALKHDFRKVDELGILDMERTVEEIRRIERMMNEVVKSP